MQGIFEEKNLLCREYKNIREREAEQGGPIEELRIVLKAGREVNGRRQREYDLPSANEVAVLLPGDDIATERRDIVIAGGDGELMNIFETHAKSDSMQYIVLHPQGEDDWTYDTHLLTPAEDVPPTYPEREEEHEDNAAEEELLEGHETGDDEGNEEGNEDVNEEVEEVEELQRLYYLRDDELAEILDGWMREDQEELIFQTSMCARAYYAYRLQSRPISDDDSRCYFGSMIVSPSKTSCGSVCENRGSEITLHPRKPGQATL